MKGDTLAAGGRSASFLMPTQVTQEQWDNIFSNKEEPVLTCKNNKENKKENKRGK